MKKTLSIVLVSLSFIIILDSFNAGEMLFMFFLAGVIPGTSATLSAAHMLQAFALLAGFTLSRITLNLIHLNAVRRSTARRSILEGHNTLSPELHLL